MIWHNQYIKFHKEVYINKINLIIDQYSKIIKTELKVKDAVEDYIIKNNIQKAKS